ncbi:MAG TPA: HAD-IA family hydrolase [Phycisphaerales bacterium]|nr:HAD-IA family hydrolase [Phycisphaerales bacterium]
MSDGRVRMVCFDAGGVLVRICRGWREGCEAAGIEFRESPDAARGDAARTAIHEDYQRGLICCDDFFSRMAETTAGLYSAAEFRAVHEAWILGEYQGARDLVQRLNDLGGVETGLLSNTNASHWAQRHMFGGRGSSAVGLLRHPHASHLLGVSKPSPEIFRAFEARTGAAPDEVLFFDDMPENVEAARRAGWRAETVDYTGDTCAQIARRLREHGVL